MPKAQLSGGISIYYEDSLKTHPDHAARPAILLIMGLGMQLTHWPETLVERFMQRGFRVIRMDNRDIGLSSFLDDRPTPILRCTLCSVAGLPVGRVPYTLADMANDAVGVLDACAVDRAHVMGASMGGMIGQWMAINHANRVQSLTSVMSSTSVRWLPRGSWSILYMITVGRPAKTAPFDTQREHSWKVFNAIRGSANTVSQKEYFESYSSTYSRSFHPIGAARQTCAIIADENKRAAQLHNIACPTLVLHGREDSLTPLQHGVETACAIPNAQLAVFDGMGHEFPPALVPLICDRIVSHMNGTAKATPDAATAALLMAHLKRRRGLSQLQSLSLVLLLLACVVFRAEVRAVVKGWLGL